MSIKSAAKKVKYVYIAIDRLKKQSKKSLSKEEARKIHIALDHLEKKVKHLELNSTSLLESSADRHRLIDEQIKKEVFEGKLHEKYHLSNEVIQSKIDNLFLSIKTTLNRLPHVFIECFDNKELRGIKARSFGKWINSLEKNIKLVHKIPKGVIKKARMLEASVLAERTTIEHGRPSKKGEFLSTISLDKFKSVTRGSIESKTSSKNDNKKKIIGGKAHWMKFINYNDPEFYYYYVHFSPFKEVMEQGYRMQEGKAIGRVYHSIKSHFKKHGEHQHIFSAPKVKGVTNRFPVSVEDSPEPMASVAETCTFIAYVLKALNNRIKSRQNN